MGLRVECDAPSHSAEELTRRELNSSDANHGCTRSNFLREWSLHRQWPRAIRGNVFSGVYKYRRRCLGRNTVGLHQIRCGKNVGLVRHFSSPKGTLQLSRAPTGQVGRKLKED